MRLERAFLFSKLARRIFWLFVLCALIPIAVLSAVSVSNVTAQLNEQSHRLLRQTSHEAAMNILEHLTFLEADMRLIGSTLEPGAHLDLASPPAGIPAKLEDRFNGLEIVTDKGNRQVVYGKVAVALEFSEDERKFLHSGKSLLSTRNCPSPAPCVFLSQEVSRPGSGGGTLVAEINVSQLWDADNLPPLINLCVLDDAGRSLYCPDVESSQFPSKIASTLSGEFDWENREQEYLSDYWSAPLKPQFFVSHWTVIASEARSDVLAPLNHFKRIFLLTVLLAFWVVLLLSLIQIRRNMVPLARLQEGTRRLTGGDLGARVIVPGADEFADLASSFNFMATRIEKQVNSLKTISEIDRAILSSWNIQQIVDALIAGLHGLFRYDFVSITLLDPNSTFREFTYVAAAEAVGEKHVTTIMLSAEDAAALSQCPEIATFSSGETVPSYLTPLAQQGMRSFLVAPILLKGKLSAIISLGHRSDSAWSEEDKRQAAQLADQVAVALSNARLVAELKQLHWGTLTALARAIDAKSHWTAGHSERVTSWAMKIARAMGLPEPELEIIHRGGLLHDIGKIGTPVNILDKPGKLTDEEMQQMREHVRIGARIMEPIPGFTECLPIILQHHEWVDGSGYPEGLAGDEISLHARIFAVADCYDALISDRPYRSGMSPERVKEIIQAGVGKQFDPRVVEKFLILLEHENRKEAAEDVSTSPVAVT
jgi:putative nucleotidyltransferase with HDIG domain